MKMDSAHTQSTLSKVGAAAIVVLLSLVVLAGGSLSLGTHPDSADPALIDPPASPCEGGYGLPNPADVLCAELGYQIESVQGIGGERSNCIFPDGSSCDSWEFYAGTCGEAYSYCATLGYEQITKEDGGDPFSRRYAVCVRGNRELGSVADLLSLSQRYNRAILLPQNPVDRSSESANGVGIAAPADLPATFDWRNHDGIDWMTAVHNQADCGSCWAFSAVGTMEAKYNIALDAPSLDLDLAEEFLNSDCPVPNPGSCCGGSHDSALEYLKSEGIPDEACMPYDEPYYVTGSCGCFGRTPPGCDARCSGLPDACSNLTCDDRCADWEDRLVTIADYHAVASTVNDIKQDLVDEGPIAVCLAMSGNTDPDGVYRCTTCWDRNSNGTCEAVGVCGDAGTCTEGLVGTDCSSDQDCDEDRNDDGDCDQDDCGINHCVVIVGYDENDDFWMVKNSWGSGWDGDGYWNVGYGECHIEAVPYYVEAADLNFHPDADADGPYAGNEGASIPFDGTGSSDPNGDALTYAWDFGDGSTGTGAAPSHTYDDDGEYPVCLTVTDAHGLSDEDCTTASIASVAPTATFNHPTEVDEGSTFVLSLTGPYDPSSADTAAGFEYVFDCGEGWTGWSTESTITCDTADDNGTLAVVGSIRDKDGELTDYYAEVVVRNVAPTATFNHPTAVDEGSTFELSLTDPYDPSPIDTAAGFDYNFNCGDGWTGWSTESTITCDTADDDGMLAVVGSIRDKDGGYTDYSADVVVLNVAPTATFNHPTEVDEGSTFELSLTDPYDPSPIDTATGFDYSFNCGDGWTDWSGSNTVTCQTYDNGTLDVAGEIRDKDGGVSEYTAEVTVVNLPPVVSVDTENQTIQYSDYICDVTFTATDVAADTLTASPDTLPDTLSLTDADCEPSADGIWQTCTWTIEGTIDEPQGDYVIGVTVADEDGGSADEDTTIVVEPEDADSWLDSDNEVAVQVDTPGGNSPAFTLTAYVQETTPDEAACEADPGDMYNAQVLLSLVPVGPGGTIDTLCTQVSVTGTGYDAVLEVACTFEDVPVNTYWVQASAVGGYYTSATAEDVLVVYDPSLGFTTGGGWFYWPGTTDKTNFGYTMKYNRAMKNIQGNLLLIRHLADGSIYRLKSNALRGLSVGEFEEADVTVGWASFAGKCTYQEPDWTDPEGNHRFIVYVEDWNEPGAGYDQFWLELQDKKKVVIPAMSMPRPGAGNTVTLGGGNIVVPHKPALEGQTKYHVR